MSEQLSFDQIARAADTWLTTDMPAEQSFGIPAYNYQPTWLDRLWSSVTDPFVKTGSALVESIPDFAGAMSKSFHDRIIEEAGLVPKKEVVNTKGETVVYYQDPSKQTTPSFMYLLPNSALYGQTPVQTVDNRPASGLSPNLIVGAGVAILLAIIFTRK